jgi:hypothetical protein
MTWQVNELPDLRALKGEESSRKCWWPSARVCRGISRSRAPDIHCLAMLRAEEMEQLKWQEMVENLADSGGEDASTGSVNRYGVVPSPSVD